MASPQHDTIDPTVARRNAAFRTMAATPARTSARTTPTFARTARAWGSLWPVPA